jgi:hypothetical protein
VPNKTTEPESLRLKCCSLAHVVAVFKTAVCTQRNEGRQQQTTAQRNQQAERERFLSPIPLIFIPQSGAGNRSRERSDPRAAERGERAAVGRPTEPASGNGTGGRGDPGPVRFTEGGDWGEETGANKDRASPAAGNTNLYCCFYLYTNAKLGFFFLYTKKRREPTLIVAMYYQGTTAGC